MDIKEGKRISRKEGGEDIKGRKERWILKKEGRMDIKEGKKDGY